MSGFTPFKPRAKAFNYRPRYYDPLKEEREQRRLELTGRRSETNDKPLRSGDLLRGQIEARRKNANRKKKRSSLLFLISALVVMMLLISNLYPRIATFVSSASNSSTARSVEREAEFNPYTPITIVPNDYQEEE